MIVPKYKVKVKKLRINLGALGETEVNKVHDQCIEP
jgi:hypothetical protein